MPDEDFWPEVEVKKNHLTAKIGDFWDIEFKTNWVMFRRRKRDIFLKVDFRGDHVEIDGSLDIGGKAISLKEKSSQIGQVKFGDVHLQACNVGVAIGPRGRILRPHFAQATPRMVYLPHWKR